MARKLLNVDSNAKTVKGQKQGYMTGVLYLAPWKVAGINMCAMAEVAGCFKGCLFTAGRGGIAKDRATFATPVGDLPDNAIIRARIARTRLYAEDIEAFGRQLVKEIEALQRKAARKGLIPVVRPNGTSDIQWELLKLEAFGGVTVFERFPDIQFYDYTKIAKRFRRELPANYHLSLSYSEANEAYARSCKEAREKYNASLVVVLRSERFKQALLVGDPTAVDGDETDLRFLDAPGSLVYLRAKGAARRDTSGFVIG